MEGVEFTLGNATVEVAVHLAHLRAELVLHLIKHPASHLLQLMDAVAILIDLVEASLQLHLVACYMRVVCVALPVLREVLQIFTLGGDAVAIQVRALCCRERSFVARAARGVRELGGTQLLPCVVSIAIGIVAREVRRDILWQRNKHAQTKRQRAARPGEQIQWCNALVNSMQQDCGRPACPYLVRQQLCTCRRANIDVLEHFRKPLRRADIELGGTVDATVVIGVETIDECRGKVREFVPQVEADLSTRMVVIVVCVDLVKCLLIHTVPRCHAVIVRAHTRFLP